MDLQKVTPKTAEQIEFPQEHNDDYQQIQPSIEMRQMTIEERIGILTAKDIYIESSTTSKKEKEDGSQHGFTELQLIEMLRETDLAAFNEFNARIFRKESSDTSLKIPQKMVPYQNRSKGFDMHKSNIKKIINLKKKKVPDLSNLTKKNIIPSIKEVEDQQFTNRNSYRDGSYEKSGSNQVPKASQEPKNYSTVIQNIELDDSILKDQKGNIFFERKRSDNSPVKPAVSFPI